MGSEVGEGRWHAILRDSQVFGSQTALLRRLYVASACAVHASLPCACLWSWLPSVFAASLGLSTHSHRDRAQKSKTGPRRRSLRLNRALGDPRS